MASSVIAWLFLIAGMKMTYKHHVKKDLVWLTVWEDTVHPREGVASDMRGRERRGRRTGLLNSLPSFCSVHNPAHERGHPHSEWIVVC